MTNSGLEMLNYFLSPGTWEVEKAESNWYACSQDMFSLHLWFMDTRDSSLNGAQWEKRKQFVVKLVKAINKMDL